MRKNQKGFTVVELSVAIGVGAFILLIFISAFKIGESFKKKLELSGPGLTEGRNFLRQFDNDLRRTQEAKLLANNNLEIFVNQLSGDRLLKVRIVYSIESCGELHCVTRTDERDSKRVFKIPHQVNFCYPISECMSSEELMAPQMASTEKKFIAFNMNLKNKKAVYLFEIQGVMDNYTRTEKWWSL